LYTDEDIERLELILNLTRDLGVNLAGVEIILNMREKMDQMQREFNRFFEMLRDYMSQNVPFTEDPQAYQALVPTRRTVVVRSTTKQNLKNQSVGEPENLFINTPASCPPPPAKIALTARPQSPSSSFQTPNTQKKNTPAQPQRPRQTPASP